MEESYEHFQIVKNIIVKIQDVIAEYKEELEYLNALKEVNSDFKKQNYELEEKIQGKIYFIAERQKTLNEIEELIQYNFGKSTEDYIKDGEELQE